MKRAWLVIVLAASCARPGVRFANAPAVTAVDDRHDVAKPPSDRPFYGHLYHFDGTVYRRLVRALEVSRHHRAVGVNALDEVPDSTWFTNRDPSLDELRDGPGEGDTPELHKPWTITSTKVGGTEIGFIIKDARGRKYLLKFDLLKFPEQETATHVIVGRLLWALGYNTTEDYVVKFGRDDLVLAKNAVVIDDDGHKSPLDRTALDSKLRQVARDPDGQIRAMASRWIEGKAVGGHPGEGVRDDDPNDRIPHELRRDLRGLYPILAWLDHVDIQESNFLDAWAPDPRDPRRHYVVHYLIDFGKSLGVMDTTSHDPRHGYEYVVDFAQIGRSLLSVGTLERSWEGQPTHHPRGVGLYDPAPFDPGRWKPDFPSYVPLLTSDRFDKFWGAKLMMRLTRDQLRTIVEAGRLSDPRAVDYLTETLIARQRATGAYWFARVNPLDNFAIANDALCFDDLMLAYDLGAAVGTTRYAITLADRSGRIRGDAMIVRPDPRGHACVPVGLGPQGDGYTIARVKTIRPGFEGETLVHFARDPATRAPRVIGIWRM